MRVGYRSVIVAAVAGAIGAIGAVAAAIPTPGVYDRDARFPVRPGDDWDFGAECPISAPLPASSPDSHPHKRPSGIDQRRSIVASQAWAPLSSIVTANIAGSIDLIDQPSTKAARSSACDTRRGPQSPGWRSLKHIR